MSRRRPVLLALLMLATTASAADTRKSGFDTMGPATQAMQKDDTQNPAMLWVAEGESLWSQPAGPAGKSCAGCHDDARKSMHGVAARMPAWDAKLARPVGLQEKINLCRARHQGAPPHPADHKDLLSLEAFVALQSRGLPIAPWRDPRLSPYYKRGEAHFTRRLGQLDLSCAHCHQDNAGKRLAGALIPQGHPTGYPLYRLEWQELGSLQRRIRNCMTGVRAEPFPAGSVELVELEVYLRSRAAGMSLDAPAVRP